jgi:hypothetical protein
MRASASSPAATRARASPCSFGMTFACRPSKSAQHAAAATALGDRLAPTPGQDR